MTLRAPSDEALSGPVRTRAPSAPVAPRFGPSSVLLGIAALGVTGILAELFPGHWVHFDLDGEFTVPAAWSSLLLGGAGLAAALSAVGARSARGATVVFAVLLCLMALDEAFSFHEWLEVATGVDWQVLYLPVMALGGVAFLVLVRDRRTARAQVALLCGGAAGWVVAQALEFAQWDGEDRPRAHYVLYMVPEELLEMLGSAAWLGAMVLVLAAQAERRRGTGSPLGR